MKKYIVELTRSNGLSSLSGVRVFRSPQGPSARRMCPSKDPGTKAHGGYNMNTRSRLARLSGFDVSNSRW